MMLIQVTQKNEGVSQDIKAAKKCTKQERTSKCPNFRTIMGDLEGQPVIFG